MKAERRYVNANTVYNVIVHIITESSLIRSA